MAIKPVQLNNDATNPQFGRNVKPYLDAEGPVSTENNVKPLPPKGHLVDDNLLTGTKYFFKDIGYDMKSVRNGFNGSANDHQLGRLNDVGLRLGGIGIATYLASRTTNPRARLMEYIGLATFLTSMAIYPKIAINFPAKVLHGYDIDKQYIDDQGRKKSVQQDSNYVPYDMYNGANKGEDFDAIGDKMGIPRDIKNRHDVIKEQMRKIATQNNTLWMLTAGFATPLMTALICNGIEKYVVTPGLEKARNNKYNSQIESMLIDAKNMNNDIKNVKNPLSDSIEGILSKYKSGGKLSNSAISADDSEKIIELFTKENDIILNAGIKDDLSKLLSGNEVIRINNSELTTMFEEAKKSMNAGGKADFITKNILPSATEIENLIKEIKPDADLTKGTTLTPDEFSKLKTMINEAADKKLNASDERILEHSEYIKDNVAKFVDKFNKQKEVVLTDEAIEKTIDFAKVIGDFKKKIAILDKCEHFKFEHAPETILANYYGKFQEKLIKSLDISPKDYKRMSNDKDFTQKILDKKINELVQNSEKYNETISSLGKILSDMENALHGSAKDTDHIKNLINGIETVYGKTSERLTQLGIGENTTDRLIKGRTINIESDKELNDLLNGIVKNEHMFASPDDIEAMKYFANGKGSSKNLRISRLINRYQGEMNSFYRIFHTLDFYKRAANPDEMAKYAANNDSEYIQKLIQKIKDSMLSGTISDYTMKHGIENVNEYKDFYNVGWALEAQNIGEITQKGIVSESTAKELNKYNDGKLLSKIQTYITRFKNIIANDTTDFTKPLHILDGNILNKYAGITRTNEAKFNLVAQDPVDMLQKAAGKRHADKMWQKKVGILTAAIFGIAFLAQFSFGKINNKHNLQKINKNDDTFEKQVNHETN